MPKLADWPKEKISKAAPFTYTGLDYTEPFYFKENKEKKVWICIFTCVTVRAVHLEIVDDMTAKQFLMTLQRSISRRNTPHTIILDDASQFKLTKTTVDKAWQQSIMHENVQRFTSDAGIKWKFIIEFSPWMGGFYERYVGMIKSSLRKTIQRKFLTTTQFQTDATECEHILNSRPLVYIDDDIRSIEEITPNHFLCLNPRNSAPTLKDDGNPDFKPQIESADELLEIWIKRQTHLNKLWKHWYNHYLLSLRERYQTRLQETRIKSRMNPMVGQIVHIKEDAPRSKWRMEKIVQLIENRDNEIRATSVLSVERKPKRKAASLAKNRLMALLNEEIGTFIWCRKCHEDHEIKHVIKD